MADVKTLLVLVLVLVLSCGQTKACQTPRGERGDCKSIANCPVLAAILQRPVKAEDVDYLRRSQCGTDGNLPKVCCPVQNTSSRVTPIEVSGGANYCQTYKKEQGQCIGISNCQVFLPILQNRPVKPEDAEYLRGSRCGSDGNLPKICCPFQVKPVSSNLLPSFDICGVDSQDRIYGGNEAELNEYPWMALLEYQHDGDGQRGFYCGGVLINKRYVLTAAHCLLGEYLKHWNLASIRLGEHNTNTSIDCIEIDSKKFCMPAPIDIPIEKRIVHGGYNSHDVNQYHDIGLLRLSREVTFTGSVKPICLPTTAYIQNTDLVGKRLVVSGWGKTEKKSESTVKLKLDVPYKHNSNCVTSYRNAGINLTNSQICAGGEKGKDSCSGDSGGPLMRLLRNEDAEFNWYSIGVVSFGPSRCGLDKWPGVYTKVDQYVQWIVDNLKP